MKHGRLFLCVAVLMAAPAVRADSYSWTLTSGTASFQDPANWSPNGAPGVSDSVTFGTAGAYGVSFAADAQNSGATVGSTGGTDATFGLGGCTWLLGNLTFTGSAAAHFGGGFATINGVPSVSANQHLFLESGSSSFAALNVASSGSIEVYGGDHSVSNGVGIAPTTTGTVAFRVTNGVFWVKANNNGRFVMGDSSAADTTEVRVEGGSLKLGNFDLYKGSLNVYTNGTYLTSSANIGRGNRQLGTVNIYGGTVSNFTASVLALGMGTSSGSYVSTGMICLADGVLYNSSGISLGGSTDGRTTNSVGILKVQGGRLNTASLALGGQTGTIGIYTQSAGSAWSSGLTLGNYGTGARGEVYLSGGSLALAAVPALGNAASCTGLISQTGGDLAISNSLSIGAAAGGFGYYRQSGGRAWVSGDTFIGNAAGASGLYACEGGNAKVVGTVRIGNAAGAFGRMVCSNASVYVQGDWVAGYTASATGSLEVAGGELVSAGNLILGNVAGAAGWGVISGGTNGFLKNVTVGSMGEGSLTLSGGVQTGTNTLLTVADKLGSKGTLDIAGGTNLFNAMLFGSFGTALVRITGGYTWTTNRLIVAGSAGSTGRVELTGGVLAVSTIDGRDPLGATPGGISKIVFDGGTLRHSGFLSDFNDLMVSGFGAATLTAGGAVIDTDGTIRRIDQTLVDEPGYAGRFTKKGAGKLTLNSLANAFTGPVCVEAGELAVSGAIYLTGGVMIDAGTMLNLAPAVALYGLSTASGATSRIDGALTMKAGMVLTNGAGSAFSGSGVVTGGVAFASGSVWAFDKSAYAGALRVTGTATFDSGTAVRLTGYTATDLAAGIPLIQGVGAGIVRTSGPVPVTLDGATHPYWWAVTSDGGKTFTARVIPKGTLISLF
jgi:hypothetical protein